MQAVYDAMISKFDAHGTLPGVLRRMFYGTEDRGKRAVPYCDVSPIAGASDLDTFGSDIDVIPVRVTAFVGRQTPNKAWTAYEALRDTFKYAALEAGDSEYTTVGINVTNANHPRLVSGVFQMSIDFEITIQRTDQVPATRGA